MKHLATRIAAALLPAALLCNALPAAAQPMKLTVGYQPWYAQTTTAIIIRGLELWKKYLPNDIEVEIQASLQGPVIINNMLADKMQIGYLGDMPAIVSTTKADIADIRMVAASSYSMGQGCHLLLVRKSAPQFKSPQEAVRWLDGKVVAAPKGGCTDLFFRKVMKAENITPKEYQHQGAEAIITNFRANKLDGAVIPDFPMTRINNLVGEGTARLVATGYTYKVPDAGMIVMRADFMKARPDVAKAWLKMELEAQRYMIDRKNWDKIAELVVAQNPGYTKREAWVANFGRIPKEQGGGPVRQLFPFVLDDNVRAKMADGFQFLKEIKVIDVDKPRDGALDDSLARQVAQEAKATLPLGEIAGDPVERAPRK